MRFGFEPAQDVGLQHVLENGLFVLKGGDLGGARKNEVLEGLLEIVADADRGAGALNEQSLNFALDERPALERFSLFLRYLDEDTDELSAKLSSAKDVLEKLQAGENVDDSARLSIEDLLARLLGAIEQERLQTPLQPPREIHYH